MGFCSRCGELISGQATRCRCGGLPRNASVQVSPVSSKDGNTDRWSRTYTSKDKSPSPSPSPAPSRLVPQRTGGTLPPLGMLNMDFNREEDISPPPRTPPPSDALGTSHPIWLLFLLRPSSPLKQAYIPPENTPPAPVQSDVTTDDDYPTIADESDLGDLTNTLGSTIQPKNTLPVQLCADCDTPFATDAVRYPGLDDPRGVTGNAASRFSWVVTTGHQSQSETTLPRQMLQVHVLRSQSRRGHSCDPAGKPCSLRLPLLLLELAESRVAGSVVLVLKSLLVLLPPTSSPAPETPGSGHRPRESLSFLEELKQRQTAGGGGAPSPSAIRRETLRSRSKAATPIAAVTQTAVATWTRAGIWTGAGTWIEAGTWTSRDFENDDEQNDHEDSPISPLNPDMIRRDTMGPRSASPSPAARPSRDPREKPPREKSSGDKPSPRPSRDTTRDNGDKPSPRSAMRSASRPRERSSSPPPQRSAKFADTPVETVYVQEQKKKEKPAPRSSLRSASRPRPSDPKAKRERERERERSVTPPPADDSLANSVFPVGKLTRDLGSLSIGISSVDDSNVSTSDSRPPSHAGRERPVLKTRRSGTGLRESIVESSAGSDSPSTSARNRRFSRGQIGDKVSSTQRSIASEVADSVKASAGEEEEQIIDDKDSSMDKEEEFKPTTPSRLTRRRSIGRDSPASTTGTVTPSGRVRGLAYREARRNDLGDYHDAEEPLDDIVMPIESTERCFKCDEKLHLDGSNMFVTVPGYAKTGNTGEFTPARTFHVDCFTCSVCELPFGGDAWEGQQARFVQLKDMIAHPECAPPIVRTATYTPAPPKANRAVKTAPQAPEAPMRSAPARDYAINRLPSAASAAPPAAPAPVTNRPRAGTMGATGNAPRFGGSMYCPWCSKSVSPMEMGTRPGPNGSRWHSSCLVCGGKDAKKNRKNPKDPGCGKQLDSGAKVDQDGGVWCRECIDKLPADLRPSSPVKPLVPTYTGGGMIQPQITGGGFIRPQTTGGEGFIRSKPQELRSRSPTKHWHLGELEEQVTGSGRPSSMIASGKGDFATVMALARKGVSMDEPVRERPKSVYGTRNWKM
ncbi:lim-type zinc finger-containing protein [Ceratobasidium sp. AG-Ba]|nr:lim-type zinc finger-containing protein [Ceratobasidium sp. AG-Ba]